MKELNKGQKNIVDQALEFLKDPTRQVFEFSGDPGTGKSFTIEEIVRQSGIDPDNIAPMAYTGQASIVMRQNGLLNAKTIHSWKYEYIEDYVYDIMGNQVLDPIYGIPVTKSTLVPRDLSDIDLIIVDEGYMVPLSMKSDLLADGKKIIVSGDRNQLDPINDKPAFLTDKNIPRLTEVMRQKENSGIIKVSRMALAGMNIKPGIYGDDCLVIYEDELDDDSILDSDILLCGRNSTRDKFNKHIRRNLLGINTDLPCMNEKIICRKNNWNIEVNGINLTNGLIGTVITPPSIDTFDGETFNLGFVPNMFPFSFNDLKLSYKYFTADHKEKQLLKNSRYDVGEKFDFAYCITTHLSQGSQFNNVIYFEEYVHRDVDHRKLNYVGSTRAKEKLIYVKKYTKRYY